MATGEAPETAPEMRCPACGGMYGDGLAFCPKDGAQLVAGDAPGGSPVGRVLADRYRIVRKLGEGGMGEVFEAQHIYIDKRFAIKTLRPEITSNPEAIARFHQEARSASMISVSACAVSTITSSLRLRAPARSFSSYSSSSLA